MEATQYQKTIRSYWIVWFILLALSALMIVVDQSGPGRFVLLALLLGGMIIKATLIAGQFMHLRPEKRSFMLLIVVTTILTAAIMFGLIAIDGVRVHNLSQHLDKIP